MCAVYIILILSGFHPVGGQGGSFPSKLPSFPLLPPNLAPHMSFSVVREVANRLKFGINV